MAMNSIEEIKQVGWLVWRYRNKGVLLEGQPLVIWEADMTLVAEPQRVILDVQRLNVREPVGCSKLSHASIFSELLLVCHSSGAQPVLQIRVSNMVLVENDVVLLLEMVTDYREA